MSYGNPSMHKQVARTRNVTDRETDGRTDGQTDEVHSYNHLQFYEGGLKRNSVYINLKELPHSILRSKDLRGYRHGSTEYQSMMCYGLSDVLMIIN